MDRALEVDHLGMAVVWVAFSVQQAAISDLNIRPPPCTAKIFIFLTVSFFRNVCAGLSFRNTLLKTVELASCPTGRGPTALSALTFRPTLTINQLALLHAQFPS
jgi:hypothetical protein